MNNPIDPLVGYYDRVLAEGDNTKIQILRNIHPVVFAEMGEPFNMEQYKEHCLNFGYGSRETLDTLYREFDEEWDNWRPGDVIVWADGKFGKSWPIDRIAHGYVWWTDDEHGEQMTRDTNLLRIKKAETE